MTTLSTNLVSCESPVEITILHELPKNPVGKIDKPALRKSATVPVQST